MGLIGGEVGRDGGDGVQWHVRVLRECNGRRRGVESVTGQMIGRQTKW